MIVLTPTLALGHFELNEESAELEYVHIRQLVATTMEMHVAEALDGLLAEGVAPNFEVVRLRVVPLESNACPALDMPIPDFAVYDRERDCVQ